MANYWLSVDRPLADCRLIIDQLSIDTQYSADSLLIYWPSDSRLLDKRPLTISQLNLYVSQLSTDFWPISRLIYQTRLPLVNMIPLFLTSVWCPLHPYRFSGNLYVLIILVVKLTFQHSRYTAVRIKIIFVAYCCTMCI